MVPLKEAGFQMAVPSQVPYFNFGPYFNARLCVKMFLDGADPQSHLICVKVETDHVKLTIVRKMFAC